MNPNQTYFYRNRGTWDWSVEFEMKSWTGLWKADISIFSKASLSALVLLQQIFGPLQMWTKVDLQEPINIARHSTKMKKWGLTIYQSEKTFSLNEDGHSLRLEGAEYYWPILFVAFPFTPKAGTVDASTTRASYQMPMAGTVCECQAVLEVPNGHIDIAMPWLKGRFTLTEGSNKILRSRFDSV